MAISAAAARRLARLICLALVPLPVSTPGSAADSDAIVSVVVENHGRQSADVPATFGQVFGRGSLARGQSVSATSAGIPIPLQLDAKAFHQDGSLRHGVVTLVIPRLPPGQRAAVVLARAGAPPGHQPSIVLSSLPPNFDVLVILKTKDGSRSASAKALLASGHVDPWLSGPLVSEWWVDGPLRDAKGAPDPLLHAQFGIRSYGKDRPLRIEVDVDNDWAYAAHPKTEFYDAQIQANGRTVFAKSGLVQPSYTRWRFGFWWGEPAATYVRQDLPYLKQAHVVPNYDPAITVSGAALTGLYDKFDQASHGPMSSGILEPYMPETGGRWDIAPLPHWQAVYLLTMEPHAYGIVLQSADSGASFSAHYRNRKTGAPVSLEDFPEFSTHSNLVGKPGQLPLPDSGGYKDKLVPDAAHEPALDFLPYLITGDRFYLEELQFWTEWNLSGTDPAYRGFQQGLVKFDQVRAQAWSLRTLAQAEYITPDSDRLKPVFRRQLQANLAWYENAYVKRAGASPLHVIAQTDAPYDNGRGMAPWQDDFFTWSIGYVNGLGDVDARALARWKAGFPVGRVTAPGFCWVLATPYILVVRPAVNARYYGSLADAYRATLPNVLKRPSRGDLPCGSTEMAAALGLPQAGEPLGDAQSPDGYPAILQTALAETVDVGAPQAGAAWRVFDGRTVKPQYSLAPEWAIVPRSGR